MKDDCKVHGDCGLRVGEACRVIDRSSWVESERESSRDGYSHVFLVRKWFDGGGSLLPSTRRVETREILRTVVMVTVPVTTTATTLETPDGEQYMRTKDEAVC